MKGKKIHFIAGCSAVMLGLGITAVLHNTSLVSDASCEGNAFIPLAGMSLVLDQYYTISKSADDEIMSFLSAAGDRKEEAGGEVVAVEKPQEESTEVDAADEIDEGVADEVEEVTADEADGAAVDEIVVTSTEESTALDETDVEATEEVSAEADEVQTDDALTEETEPVSVFDTIAISNVEEGGYVNIRKGPSTEDEVVGKIYHYCAGTILDTVEGEDGKWYEFTSGSVTGFIKAQYFITGDDAKEIAETIGKCEAVVLTDGLRVRQTPSLDDTVVINTMLAVGSKVAVLEQLDDWTKVLVDEGTIGYVYNECIQINLVFDTAISLEEEAAKLAEEQAAEAAAQEAARIAAQAAAAQAAAEAAAAQAAADAAAAQAAAQAAADAAAAQAAADAAAAQAAAAQAAAQAAADTSVSETRNAVVAYALQFVGTPYVWAGENLGSGVDCSGFTKCVYAQFGYYLEHYSGAQAYAGTQVSADQLRPGDLVVYGSGGGINHVALYIGNGQIVHAANPSSGVCVWSVNYNTPLWGVSVLP